MDLVQFYRAVLPETGYYALFSAPRKRHVWADSLEQLVQRTEAVNCEPDWYVAIGSFDAKERQQAHALAKRALYLDIDAGPDKFAKDPNRNYETRAQALQSLKQFIVATGLRPTLIVASGAHGLYAFFCLERDIPLAQWQPMADALKAVCKAQGLKADPACTADSARVLRFLGAKRRDGSTTTLLTASGPTWNPDDLAAKLAALTPQDPLALGPRPKALVDVWEQAGATPLFDATPKSALKVAEKCATIQWIAQLKGDVPYGPWFGMCGLVKHCVEGDDLVHEWSRGHEKYDEHETQQKIDTWAHGPTTCAYFAEYDNRCDGCPHAGKITSPIQLGVLTDKEVEAQPVAQQWAERVVEEDKPGTNDCAPWAPPDGWGEDFKVRKVAGVPMLLGKKVSKEKDEASGDTVTMTTWVPLTSFLFRAVEWVEADDEVQTYGFELYRPDGRRHRFLLDGGTATSAADTIKALGANGIVPANTSNQVRTLLMEYVNKQNRLVQAALSSVRVSRHLGFRVDSKDRLECAHGQYVIRPDQTIARAILGADVNVLELRSFGIGVLDRLDLESLSDTDAAAWDAEKRVWRKSVWVTHIKPSAERYAEFIRTYYDKPRFGPAKLAIMLEVASPLLVFTCADSIKHKGSLPSAGFTVSLYSRESGVGKTYTQKAGLAAYAKPNVTTRGGKEDSTFAGRLAIAALHGTMPFVVDEMSSADAEQTVDFINSMSGGTGKRRATQTGGVRENNTWAMICTISTNISQRDLVTQAAKNKDAIQARLLELQFSGVREDDPEVRNAYRVDSAKVFAEDYGALGAMLEMACVMNGQEKMRAFLAGKVEEASRLLGTSQEDRFFEAALGCVLAAQAILAKLGLQMFSTDELVDEFKRALDAAHERKVEEHVSPTELMRQFINDISAHIAVTDQEGHGRGEQAVLLNPNVRLPLKGRHIRSQRRIYISADALLKWCAEHGIPQSSLLYVGRAEGWLLRTPAAEKRGVWGYPYTLARGLRGFTNVAVRCYVVRDDLAAQAEGTESADNVVSIEEARKEAPPGEGQEAQAAEQ